MFTLRDLVFQSLNGTHPPTTLHGFHYTEAVMKFVFEFLYVYLPINLFLGNIWNFEVEGINEKPSNIKTQRSCGHRK